jgi:Helix-turn-helix of DDE superfamily endonuclease
MGCEEAAGKTVDLSLPFALPEASVAVLSFFAVVVAFDLEYVTGLVRRHHRSIGSKDRALPPGMQALMTLAHLKKGETFAQLGAGFGVGMTAAWWYVNETVMLSARSPKLSRAAAKAKKDGLLYLVLDGTLIPIDRLAADRRFYSGKHKSTA